jgi:hypothetical protein
VSETVAAAPSDEKRKRGFALPSAYTILFAPIVLAALSVAVLAISAAV